MAVDEALFRDWYGAYAKGLGLSPDPDDPRHHYDYRAAFAAGAQPDETGHMPSQFKREGHPRMVIDTPQGRLNTKTGEIVSGPGVFDDLITEILARRNPAFPSTWQTPVR